MGSVFFVGFVLLVCSLARKERKLGLGLFRTNMQICYYRNDQASGRVNLACVMPLYGCEETEEEEFFLFSFPWKKRTFLS